MDDCIFCKIIRGEVPSEKTHHEDGEILSMLDLNQTNPGHTLVIPSPHYRWFYELPDDLSDKMMRVMKTLAIKLKKEYSADYIEVSIVGVDVPHVHVHLTPHKIPISS